VGRQQPGYVCDGWRRREVRGRYLVPLTTKKGEGESVGGVFVAGVQPPDAAVMRSSSEKKCIFFWSGRWVVLGCRPGHDANDPTGLD
jgi:hypothetical protein